MKYIAEVHPVDEVTLIGRADGDYWAQRLAAEDLRLAAVEGQAELMISATNARYLGMPFCELSISLFVQSKQHPGPRGAAYLTHAYNSSRLLAFCERTFFRTPYFPARLEVRHGDPVSVNMGPADLRLLRLAKAANVAASETAASIARSRDEQGGWQGPIFLPGVWDRPGDVFFARLTGPTEVYDFSPGEDHWELNPTKDHPAIGALIESRFVPMQWTIRQRATHARTKTFTRAAVGL